ncbi:unnamed protein product [Caenorhabditis sp. 36 PRJEB53466]|nr:unnamed protein product [Caenorhabditis sp. 36 PRJEB53466]
MTTTRPKRITRNATPAPPVEDDVTIVRTTLDRLIYAVDVMARFDRTREDIAAVNRGESNRTMTEIMTEVRWHEHASKARKECPLGSTKKKRQYEDDEEEDEEGEDGDAPSTSKISKGPKPTPEKKAPTPSKAKLAAMKKKADAARRKAQREEAKKQAEQDGKDDEEDEELDENFIGMPTLISSVITPPPQSPDLDATPPQLTSEQLDAKSWLGEDPPLYPLDLVPVVEDVPGRVWCPPRGICQATNEQVVEIGPLTELETLDLSLSPEAFDYLLPEKAEQILIRILELRIPHLEMKMLDPAMGEDEREMNIKQLEIYEKQLDEYMEKPALLRYRIATLPHPAMSYLPRYSQSIVFYSEIDPTWYSSSREWFDKTIRNRDKICQQDFLDNFQETEDQMILDFQREMLEKTKIVEQQLAEEKIKNFKLPLVHNLDGLTPLAKERMLAFRSLLAHVFQYEDFENAHMTDPACRGIWRKIQPFPYENGIAVDEAEAELVELISSYKVQFGAENPIIPLPEAVDSENETSEEVGKATERFLADVIDTVVFRELTDLPTYPHRIPIYKPRSTRPARISPSVSRESNTSEQPTSSPHEETQQDM